MLIILSPSKKLAPSSHAEGIFTLPEFEEETGILIEVARKLSAQDLENLMGVSSAIAELNYQRFRQFSLPFTPTNSRQALDVFTGDVYDGLDAPSFSKSDREYAQKHLRILSGLYGLLRPLDLMQAYRLEMGTKLTNPRGKNLYRFWGRQIKERLQEALKIQGDNTLINLASNEYSKAALLPELSATVITPQFKEYKDERYQTMMLYAKRARGKMARFILRHRINSPEALKDFNEDGYSFRPELSSKNEWIFARETA